MPSDDISEGAEIIDAYTRREAIEDGILVQLSGPGYQGDPWIPAMVAEAGFRYPVAMAVTAFCSYVSPLEGDDTKLAPCQDMKGRLWDVLWMLKLAIRQDPDPARRAAFQPASGAQRPGKLLEAQPAKAQDRAPEGRVRAGRRRLGLPARTTGPIRDRRRGWASR